MVIGLRFFGTKDAKTRRRIQDLVKKRCSEDLSKARWKSPFTVTHYFFATLGQETENLQSFNGIILHYYTIYCITWFCKKKRNVKNPTIYHHVSIFQTLTHNSASGVDQDLSTKEAGTGGLSPLFSHELSVDVPFWVKNRWFPENIQSEALWIGRFTEFCSPEIQVICELCSTYRRIRKNEQFFILNTQSYDPWRA